MADLQDRFSGVLLGTAVGDSLGLPAEGLSRSRIQRRWHGDWRHRFVLGRGMCSDDTEHTLFVAQALLAHPDDAAAFQRCLAWKLRLWLLGAPAGIGLATLRAILRLWMGVSPERSGVFSAGNGPAMRSAIIGAYFYDKPELRKAFVSASTRLTHTDPKAETAAMAVAEAAAWGMAREEPLASLVSRLALVGQDAEWLTLCKRLETALTCGDSVTDFADSLGLAKGVSGYCYHSVPVALYAWLSSPDDYPKALIPALNCGGDTDTVGAIVGALAGATLGAQSIPAEWRNRIWEWPRSMDILSLVAARLAEQQSAGTSQGPVRYCWPAVIPRNLLFLAVVLAHGFGRLVDLAWKSGGTGHGK